MLSAFFIYFITYLGVSLAAAPDVISVLANAKKTSATLTVTLTDSAFVYCGVFTNGFPSSTDAVKVQQNMGQSQNLNPAVISISGLSPYTLYSVYCVTETTSKEATTLDDMLYQTFTFQTHCCKQITATVLSGSVAFKTDVSKFIQISSDSAPRGDVTVAFTATKESDGSVTNIDISSLLLKSSVQFTSGSWNSIVTGSLKGNSEGIYKLTGTLSGAGSDDYLFAFSDSDTTSTTFEILGNDKPLPAPAVLSASFSSNGVNIIVGFNTQTNKYNCLSLFTFTDSVTPTCAWLDDSNVIITPFFTSDLKIGSDLSINGDLLRAKCTTIDCSSWPSMKATSITVSAAASPISPVVFISGPKAIGPCDSPIFDITSSTGNGGRDWKSLVVTVTSGASRVAEVQTFFDTSYKMKPPTAIPSSLLELGESYSFQFTLCNFLNSCSSSVTTMSVSTNSAPVVTISGQQSFTQNPSLPLEIKSSAFVAACGGGKDVKSVSYQWQVTKNGVTSTLKSSSTDVSSFRLPSFSLSANSLYVFTVTASSSQASFPSSTSVKVTTGAYALVPVITGGSGSRSIAQSDDSSVFITLDGSTSYDQGSKVPGASSASLSYTWTCATTWPSISDTCAITPVASNDVSLTFATTSDAKVDDEYTVTLTITDGSRVQSTSVVVVVVAPDTPLVTISSSLVKVNPTSILTLPGSVVLSSGDVATWSVEGDDLEGKVLTSISKDLMAGAQTHNLVVSADAFIGRVSPYVFTLTCGAGSSSISILFNMPPTIGALSFDSESGYALDTIFTISAVGWADEDLPLRYEFGYVTGDVFAIVQGSSEQPYAASSLPAGDASNANKLSTRVRVYDSLRAMSHLDKEIEVLPKLFTTNQLATKLDSASEVSGAGNTDQIKAVVSGVTSYLNSDKASDNTAVYDKVILSVGQIMSNEDPSDDVVVGWITAMSQASSSPDQLSGDSASALTDLAYTAMTSAAGVGSSYGSVGSILDVIDAVGQVTQSGRRRRLETGASTVSTGDILDSYGSYVSGSMVEGQDPIAISKSTFSLSAQVASPGDSKAVTATLSGDDSTSCLIDGEFGSAVPLYMASTVSSAVSNTQDYPLFSGSIRVGVHSDHLSSIEGFTFSIKNEKAPSKAKTKNQTYSMTCSTFDESSFTFDCKNIDGSTFEYTQSCYDAEANTHLDPGIYDVQCPTQKHVAACKVFTGASLYDCGIDAATSTDALTVCVCKPLISERRLDAESDFEDSGALEVAAATELVVDEFAATMRTAADLNSVSDLKHVLIVLFLYGGLWGVGLSGLAFCTISEKRRQRQILTNGAPIEHLKAQADQVRTKENVHQYLSTYVNSVFPAVFCSESGWYRLWVEIKRHHRYILLFTAEGNDKAHRVLTGVHLMTVQSMLMFMLAVVYDLQFPTDDGSCGSHSNEDSCLKKRSVFDTTSSVCEWRVEDTCSVDTGSDYCCSFVQPAFSFSTMIIISIVVAVLTTPVNIIVDFLCVDILSAPSADDVKARAQDTVVKQVGRRMSNAARRASNVTAQAVSDLAKKMESKRSRQTMVSKKALVVPGATHDAHTLATSSVKGLLDDAKSSNQEFINSRSLQRVKSLTIERSRSERRATIGNSSSVGEIVNNNGVLSNANIGKSAVTNVGINATVEALFMELNVDMKDQRRKLKPFEQEDFDNKWGVDPTGEFSQQTGYLYYFMSLRKNAKHMIMKTIKSTVVEAEQAANKLAIATDLQIGLEILHLFVLDVLGRHSSAAKIFSAKSSEDFRHQVIVTKWAKRAAGLALVLLNFFFVYFSILRGLQRGHGWQMIYLAACLMQIAIEMVIYETSECAIVHFAIPSLVHEEIRNAAVALHKAVDKICSNMNNTDEKVILDAPQYLFVSTNLAKKYPDLMESVIVQSYHSYLPGQIGTQWRINHAGRGANIVTRFANFALTSIFFQTLQRLGAMPGSIQRIIIHSLQPFLVSSLLILWFTMVNQPYIAIPVGAVLLYILFKVVQEVRRHRSHPASIKGTQITPVPDGDYAMSEKQKNERAITPANDSEDGHSTRPGSYVRSNNTSRPGSSDKNVSDIDIDENPLEEDCDEEERGEKGQSEEEDEEEEVVGEEEEVVGEESGVKLATLRPSVAV